MITPPNRRDALTGGNNSPTSRFAEYLERVADDINTLNADVDTLEADVTTLQTQVASLQADVDVLNQIGEDFSATNVTTTLSFDADTVTLPELADVVGSIIQKLQ